MALAHQEQVLWRRVHGELVPGVCSGLRGAGRQLQRVQGLVLGSGWESVLPWEAQGGGQRVLPGSELAVALCSGPRREAPLPQRNCPSKGIPQPSISPDPAEPRVSPLS